MRVMGRGEQSEGDGGGESRVRVMEEGRAE